MIKIPSLPPCKPSHPRLHSNLELISVIYRLSGSASPGSLNSDNYWITTQKHSFPSFLYNPYVPITPTEVFTLTVMNLCSWGPPNMIVQTVSGPYLIWSRGHVRQSLLSCFHCRNPHGTQQRRKQVVSVHIEDFLWEISLWEMNFMNLGNLNRAVLTTS